MQTADAQDGPLQSARPALGLVLVLALVGAVLGAAAGLAYASSLPPLVRANAVMSVASSSPVVEGIPAAVDDSTALVQGELIVLNGKGVRDEVRERLGSQAPPSYSAAQVGSGTLIEVGTEGRTTAQALLVLDQVLAVYSEDRQARLQAEIDRAAAIVDDELARLEQRIAEEPLGAEALQAEYGRLLQVRSGLFRAAANVDGAVAVVQPPAAVSGGLSSTSRFAGLGLLIGALLGVGVASVANRARRGVRGPEDLLDTGIPVLHPEILPHDGSVHDYTGDGDHASAVRLLVGQLVRPGEGASLVLFGAADGGGTSHTAAAAAACLSERSDVLLVLAADVVQGKDGTAASELGVVAASSGLVSLPVDRLTPEAVLEAATPSVLPGVAVLTRGPGEAPATLLARLVGAGLLEACLKTGRTVVVDAPALTASTTTVDLAGRAGGAVLVVGRGAASRRDIDTVRQLFERQEIPLLGAVVNRAGRRTGRTAQSAPRGTGRRRPATDRCPRQAGRAPGHTCGAAGPARRDAGSVRAGRSRRQPGRVRRAGPRLVRPSWRCDERHRPTTGTVTLRGVSPRGGRRRPPGHGLWWASPLGAVLLVVPGSLWLAWSTPDLSYRLLYRSPKVLDGGTSLLFAASGLALLLGVLAATSSRPRGWPARWPLLSTDELRLVQRASTVCFWLTMTGYTAFAVAGVARGARPDLLVDAFTSQANFGGEIEALFAPVTGITTLTQVGVAYVVLAALLWTAGQRRSVARRLALVFVLALLRAYLFTERLAIIEVAVPFVVVLAVAAHRRGDVRAALAPVVALPGLVVLFGLFEYSRSWTFFRSRTTATYPEFVVDRLAGYYATAYNNGAAQVLHGGHPDRLPYYVLEGFWTAPGIEQLDLYGRLSGREPGADYEQLLLQRTNPEFSNPCGICSPVIDLGTLGGLLWLVLAGFVVGALWCAFRDSKPAGLVAYPLVLLGLLELPRYLYWTQGRLIPAAVALGIVALLLHRRRRPVRAAPHLEALPERVVAGDHVPASGRGPSRSPTDR